MCIFILNEYLLLIKTLNRGEWGEINVNYIITSNSIRKGDFMPLHNILKIISKILYI